jgi:hypothetical protein
MLQAVYRFDADEDWCKRQCACVAGTASAPWLGDDASVRTEFFFLGGPAPTQAPIATAAHMQPDVPTNMVQACSMLTETVSSGLEYGSYWWSV